MKLYSTVKLFNSYDLPHDLFNKLCTNLEVRNDSYHKIKVNVDDILDQGLSVSLYKWLIENGAKVNEEVIIFITW